MAPALTRAGAHPGHGFHGYESLSENGREIYDMLEQRYGFK